jgi:flagellar protein FliL
MSTAVAQAADAPPKKKKKRLSKKLVIMLAAASLLLGVTGAGATYWMKHKAAQVAAEVDGEGGDADAKTARYDHKHPPSFVPLDPFTVNLADKEVERYAQVGVTLEIENAKTGEQIKLYMPAIRNGILMILAHKNSQELLERAGKEQLAREIQVETARTIGYEVTPRATNVAHEVASKTAAKATAPAEPNPVRRVHFSNFIIQ